MTLVNGPVSPPEFPAWGNLGRLPPLPGPSRKIRWRSNGTAKVAVKRLPPVSCRPVGDRFINPVRDASIAAYGGDTFNLPKLTS